MNPQELKSLFPEGLRNRGEGYDVSTVRAGAKLVGRDAGPVRAPLSNLLPTEMEALGTSIKKLGAQ